MGIGRDDPAFLALRTEFLDNYAAHMTDRSRPFEGVPVMLEALRAAGIRTGVVTNKVEHLALRLTDNLGLDGQLDVVLGSDSEGCAMKPAPDSLLTAARLTGVHVTDILYAGDDPRDVAAAHAAGMPCAACTWGYAVTPPESWGADLVAHSPAELATWAVQLNAHAL
ncbi:MAG: HAD family hydrolase [Sutterella wadsworthensis]